MGACCVLDAKKVEKNRQNLCQAFKVLAHLDNWQRIIDAINDSDYKHAKNITDVDIFFAIDEKDWELLSFLYSIAFPGDVKNSLEIEEMFKIAESDPIGENDEHSIKKLISNGIRKSIEIDCYPVIVNFQQLILRSVGQNVHNVLKEIDQAKSLLAVQPSKF